MPAGGAAGGGAALVGLQLAIIPQLVGGSHGMPVTIDEPTQFRAHAIVAAVGSIVASGGAAVVAGNLLVSLRRSLGSRR